MYGEGDVVHHAELSWPFGGGIMLGSARDDGADGPTAPGPCSAYIVVDEPDALCARMRAGGAEVTVRLRGGDYGSHDFAIRDPEGNRWYFGTCRGAPRASCRRRHRWPRTRCSSCGDHHGICRARTGYGGGWRRDEARRRERARRPGRRPRRSGWRGSPTRARIPGRHTPGVTAAPATTGAAVGRVVRRRGRGATAPAEGLRGRRCGNKGRGARPPGIRPPRTKEAAARGIIRGRDDLRDRQFQWPCSPAPTSPHPRAQSLDQLVAAAPVTSSPAPARARSSRCGWLVDVVDLEGDPVWSAGAVIFGESVRMSSASPSSDVVDRQVQRSRRRRRRPMRPDWRVARACGTRPRTARRCPVARADLAASSPSRRASLCPPRAHSGRPPPKITESKGLATCSARGSAGRRRVPTVAPTSVSKVASSSTSALRAQRHRVLAPRERAGRGGRRRRR